MHHSRCDVLRIDFIFFPSRIWTARRPAEQLYQWERTGELHRGFTLMLVEKETKYI